MKSVLISIQPKWCELIASGKKTVAVKKASTNKGNSFDTTMRELAEFVGEDTEFDIEDTDEYRDIMGGDDNA